MFSKTKKAEEENRKLRFIESSLRSFLRDVKDINEYPCSEDDKKERINIMIEIRAKEIIDWL